MKEITYTVVDESSNSKYTVERFMYLFYFMGMNTNPY